MTAEAHAPLHQRARRARAQAAMKAWEYRQRAHAKGVWFRLQRLLAEAESAWAIPEQVAQDLVASGIAPHPVGLELEPQKTILVVDEGTLASIAGRSRLPLQVGAALLGARQIALVRLLVLLLVTALGFFLPACRGAGRDREIRRPGVAGCEPRVVRVDAKEEILLLQIPLGQ